MTGLRHPPLRPSWDCATCGQPWACHPARVELAERYAGDPISLAVYVGMQLDHAAREMPNADPGDLYERFVAWTRYRQSTTT